MVAGDALTPQLLIEGANSPHTFNLRPSQARMIQSAKLFFWFGPELETPLDRPVDSLGASSAEVRLLATPGLDLLPYRDTEDFHAASEDSHDHEHSAKAHDDHHDEDSHRHDDHAHEGHKEEGHKGEAHDDHGHDGHDHAGSFDPHVWLDPKVASRLIVRIEHALSETFPENAEVFRENARNAQLELAGVEAFILAKLMKVKQKRFVTFHDITQYYEQRFGLQAAGTVTLSPEKQPGAEHLKHLKEQLVEQRVVCVFSEPQFAPKLVQTLIEGTNVKTAEIDQLGASLEPGPDHYPEMMRQLAVAFADCLAD